MAHGETPGSISAERNGSHTTSKRQALEELLQNCISSQALLVALEGFQPQAELGIDMCILRIQEAFG
jgi:hypothetical protein